jgi:hypothetical protein
VQSSRKINCKIVIRAEYLFLQLFRRGVVFWVEHILDVIVYVGLILRFKVDIGNVVWGVNGHP